MIGGEWAEWTRSPASIGGVNTQIFNHMAGTSGTQVKGTAFLTPNGSQGTWSMVLSASAFSDGQAANLHLNVPQFSTLDINAPVTTPEPASIFLAISGLGGLLYFRRRKV